MDVLQYSLFANQYIEDVLNGKQSACKYIKQACERQKRDLEIANSNPNSAYIFKPKLAGKFCAFIEALPHIKGSKSGQPFILEPWECFVITTMFGWVWRNAPHRRRFRISYLEIPRGNGKSAIAAAIALACLTIDREGGAEVYSAATTREQARIVFDTARAMAKKSPGLQRHLGVQVGAKSIYVPSSVSKMSSLSAEAGNLDGLNTHLGIIDELHAHRTRAVFDVIETSIGKRDRSMLLIVTTAGTNRLGICYENHDYLVKILDPNNDIEDDHYFGVIYTVDEGDPWDHVDTWIKANPNFEVSVKAEVLDQLCNKAKQSAAAKSNFCRKHLNIWCAAESPWIDVERWDALAQPYMWEKKVGTVNLYVGIDIATRLDILAVMFVLTWKEGANRHYHLMARYVAPEATINQPLNTHYRQWVRDGWLIKSPGSETDLDLVERLIIDIHKNIRITEAGYDPWQSAQMATHLANEGMITVEVRPNYGNFSPAMKEIEGAVASNRLTHDGSPITSWMIGNTIAFEDNKENIQPKKATANAKIDGVVAAITAVNRAMIDAPRKTASVYETRGVLTFGR